VGVYSGEEKLGEGTGSAIRMAEYRAAEDALRRFYLSERPIEQLSLPSITLDADFTSADVQEIPEQKTIWNIDSTIQSSSVFTASPIGHSEVVFGSKG
jgi:large subunit ribosomal protein L44